MPATHLLHRLTLCVTGLMLLLATAPAAAQTDIGRFDDAGQAAKNWFAVNDTVMGGVSKGRVDYSNQGHLVFSGELSLKNNGGFASIRTRDKKGMLGNNNTITVKLRGDGRTYYLSLRDKDRRMAASHRKPIMTEKGKWIQVSARLDEFKYTRFGRQVNKAKLTPDQVIGLGFTLADKKPGAFKLEIASITASRTGKTQAKETGDILGIARSAGTFKTLLAALEASGLDKALAKPDANVTVFAPTDKAFDALPKGTVKALLKRENRDQLVELLLNHVLAEPVMLARKVTTPAGEVLTIRPRGKVTIGKANVLKADIRATNGVVHVIDRVLLPKSMQPTPQGRAMRAINSAINRGVPLYNHGNAQACAKVYMAAVESLTREHRAAVGEYNARTLDVALQLARRSHDADQNAWDLRAALDAAYAVLSKKSDG